MAQDQEIRQLMARFQSEEPNGVAVQQLEVLVRTAIFKPANQLIGVLLQNAADRIDAAFQPKPGEQRKGRVAAGVDCIFGSFLLQRDYYYHEGKKQGHYPADDALGLEGGKTPALARLVCLEGADESSYQKAELHLREVGGIEVSARQIQRLVQPIGKAAQEWQEREAQTPEPGSKAVPVMYVSGDASGVTMRKEELEGRAGKGADGKAKTRMANLGCVFTQHKRDEKGRPIRDHESTTYVSTFNSIDQFGPMLRQEAIRRGLCLAMQVVLLIDGAVALANMGLDCFRNAIQIVDFYHALEHAGKVLVALLGSKEHPDYKKRLHRLAKELLKDRVQKLIDRTREECAGTPRAEAVEKELGYFVNNVERMQYGTFRRQGFFIGSGVIEAGCKTVIGARCKQSGMFWGKPGAENILALRCIHSSRRLDQFWKERLNAHVARNDCLALAE
ncbi:MAG: ISKra4 family transposase [Acidobacteria bacterium]|nr:MAG: ISKra4 family transposase [Acidobacteriota bacterium]